MKVTLTLLLLATVILFVATQEEENSTDLPSTRQNNCGSAKPVFVSVGYQGRFATPHYPNFYSSGANCLWLMTTSANGRFSVTCDPFSVSCADDTFIYSPTGDVSFSDASRPVCGNRAIQFNSTTNAISLSFRSSYYSSGGRFQCIAQAIAPPAQSSNCDCGIKGQNRVVGGQPSGLYEWPWQALLADISQQGGGDHFCGATLIGHSWAVTAAHCTNGRLASNIGFVVGQYDSSALKPTAQVKRVAQIVQHPSFDRRTVNNDIALIKLDSPVTYTSAVRPVCLPIRYANSDFDGQTAYITGWGTTSYGGETSDPLMEVAVSVLSTQRCRQYQTISSKITDNMFCTYTEGKDACQGDSGGPLNWQDPSSGRVYLIGITSFGIGCAKPNVPGVYTKITNYLGWIQQYTGVSCTI